jgi:hypothetical protein
MHVPAILLLAALTAPINSDTQPEHFDWNGHPVVVFQCDFTQYPPKANVEYSSTACDYSIAFDRHPHLRLTLVRKAASR